jgi:carboxypeptidase Taq
MSNYSMEPRRAYEQAVQIMQTASDLAAAAALLGWDQETYMPPRAADARAEQLATLSALVHSTLTSNDARELAYYFESADSLDGELDDTEKRIAKLFAREVQRDAKLPDEFVRRKARTTSLAQEAWKRARAESSFELFSDHLRRVVDVMIEEATIRGYTEHPYDALLDIYEPGATVRQLDPIFDRLERATADLLDAVARSGIEPSDDVLHVHYPASAQVAAARRIVEAMGFDFAAGRVDLSAHPFCTSFSVSDVRLTTRINEHDIRACLFGLIHEAGHGLYEQGISPRLERTLARDGASMGIHESQSLFWENIVARSEEFWYWALPVLREYFPEQLGKTTPEQMYAAINRVRPSLIRIEADEITYNLHIVLRYRIEKDLIAERIKVEDIPMMWNEAVKSSLGIEVTDDAHGCLQDIHWSFGGFGYFPSYTLGKLYAAMFRTALLDQMPEAPSLVRRGEFGPIRQWLRAAIHQWGRTFEPAELVHRVTGRSLTEEDFVAYAWSKVRRIYGDV